MIPTLQDYSPKSRIEGVKIFTSKTFVDDGGEFKEIGRFGIEPFTKTYIESAGSDYYVESECSIYRIGDDACQFDIKQANHSIVEPGAIKAFHLHEIQTDIWYVIDKALVILYDTRPFSSTFKEVMRLTPKNQHIVIPPGVAHGIGNPYNHRVNMIYFVDRTFNPKDELRLPWDIVGKEIWEIQNG